MVFFWSRGKMREKARPAQGRPRVLDLDSSAQGVACAAAVMNMNALSK
jgi:hypothetical protein